MHQLFDFEQIVYFILPRTAGLFDVDHPKQGRLGEELKIQEDNSRGAHQQ